jgi:hypothetical protein
MKSKRENLTPKKEFAINLVKLSSLTMFMKVKQKEVKEFFITQLQAPLTDLIKRSQIKSNMTKK